MSFGPRVSLPLAAACFLLGIVWILLFPLATISVGKSGCRKTFVSENAIPKGFVPSSRLGVPSPAGNLSAQLAQQFSSAFPRTAGPEDRVDWFASCVAVSMAAVGAGTVSVQAATCPNGTPIRNVVGVVRGKGRMANQEAFAVAAGFDVSSFTAEAALPTLPVHAVFRLISTLSNSTVLPKDAVFVVSVFGEGCGCVTPSVCHGVTAGLDAWAGSVLDEGSGVGARGYRPGLLRGAIVLHWDPAVLSSPAVNLAVLTPVPLSQAFALTCSAYVFAHMCATVCVQAPWGRLPDMDIVTLIMHSVRMPVTVSPHTPTCKHSSEYTDTLTGLFSFMAYVALGPYAPHSPFLTRKYVDVARVLVCVCDRHYCLVHVGGLCVCPPQHRQFHDRFRAWVRLLPPHGPAAGVAGG